VTAAVVVVHPERGGRARCGDDARVAHGELLVDETVEVPYRVTSRTSVSRI
jgi:hypothetical protein